MKEKDIVLSIATKLGSLLNRSGISIKYSRTTYTYLSLEERARLLIINYDKSNSQYNLLVLNYLRHLAYFGAFLDFSLGSAGPFVDYFKKNHSSLHNKLLKYIGFVLINC